MTIKIRWADNNLEKYSKDLGRLSAHFPKVLPRILNQAGDLAKTQVTRALVKQTGLKRQTIVDAIGRPSRAHEGRLSYIMRTEGGNVRVQFFNPREINQGVVAKPFGKSTLFPGAFMRGGAFPNRKVVSKWDGKVWYRLNSSGSHLAQAKSGVFIPKEMETGETKAAFDKTSGPVLEQRVTAAIKKLLPK